MIQREVRCRGVADRAERGPYRGNDRVVIRCIVVDLAHGFDTN